MLEDIGERTVAATPITKDYTQLNIPQFYLKQIMVPLCKRICGLLKQNEVPL